MYICYLNACVNVWVVRWWEKCMHTWEEERTSTTDRNTIFWKIYEILVSYRVPRFTCSVNYSTKRKLPPSRIYYKEMSDEPAFCGDKGTNETRKKKLSRKNVTFDKIYRLLLRQNIHIGKRSNTRKRNLPF